MKFVTFGTRVMDDAIVGSQHQNKLRITGVSPFCIWGGETIKDLEIDSLKQVSPDSLKMLQFQLDNSLEFEIRNAKYDFFCIDFLDAWRPIMEFCFKDGIKVRITENIISKKNEQEILINLEKIYGKLVSKNNLDPLKWDKDVLETEMNRFMDWLDFVHISNQGKMVLIDERLPYQKLDINQIIFSQHLIEISSKNIFAEKCFDIMKKRYPRCLVVPKVDIFVGGQKSSEEEPYIYIQEYYTYLLKNIEEKFSLEHTSIFHMDYMHKMQLKIDYIVFEDLVKQYARIGNNRKVILFGDSELLDGFPEFANHVHAVIPYVYQMPWNETLLEEIRGKSDNYILVFPHVFAKDNILEKLFRYGYTYPRDILTLKHESIDLSKFIGKYSDVYHNFVTIKREIVLHLEGNGCVVSVGVGNPQPDQIFVSNLLEQTRLVIEDNVRSNKLNIGLNPGSELIISRNTTFGSNDIIRASYLFKIFIGEDCMFSEKIYIQSGDDHNSYDIQSGDCINFNREMLDTNKRFIRLAGHVWIGFEAVLLAGTEIGAGAIVGARSVVNGKHPNNAIIVGSPARTVKNDVGWTRNPFVLDAFSEEANVRSIFLQKTKENDGKCEL